MMITYGRLPYLAEPRFVENPLQQINHVHVRSWRQRLLSWPWRPWVRKITISAPDPTLYFDVTTYTYSGHPATIAAFRKLWREKESLRSS